RRFLLSTDERLAVTLRELGENAQGLDYQKGVLAISQAQLATNPANARPRSSIENAQARAALGEAYLATGNTLRRIGRTKEALAYYQQAEEDYKALADADSSDTDARRQLVMTIREMANSLVLTGGPGAAIKYYRDATDGYEKLAMSDPDNAQTQHE